MKKPAVSVLIPVYNTEKYISACLQSIFQQSFTDFEIICIDDGSTDHSLQILKEIAQIESRLKIIEQSNQGVTVTRNRLLQEATGEYIAFVDADDLIEPDYLEKLYNAAFIHKAQISTCACRTIPTDFVLTSHTFFRDEFSFLVKNNTLHSRFKYAYHNGVVWGRIFHRQWLLSKKLKFKEGYVAEDFLFGILAFLEAQQICHTSQELYLYRQGVKNSITSNSDRMILDKYDHIFTLREEMKKRDFWSAELVNLWMHFLVRRVLGVYKTSKKAQETHTNLFFQAWNVLEKEKLHCTLINRWKWNIFLQGVHSFPYPLVRYWCKLFR